MIKQIKYFQAVVSHKSFTDAAEECFISQSAMSQQIQALERGLGVKLLDRKNRKFSLTPAGEYFYKKSLVITADYDRLCSETVRIANKDNAELRIGYLKCYGGQEFRLAVAEFSEKYPDVSVHIINGNHEYLYDALRNGRVDLILNDQRRAFSDEYVNLILTAKECYIEIAARNPLASLESVETEDLKNIPCILTASSEQQENEKTYYQEVVGIKGEFIFAENLEEARTLVISGKGFMPIEGGENESGFAANLRRILFTRNGKAMKRNYCAFWKADNSGYYIEDFADILKSKFSN
ncbi:MAG: LysR family transcriptional regulator [Lachnospiraceae bacterium]|nr:LysR family transcriptional regulator [Lachnospiraceae bacterium]